MKSNNEEQRQFLKRYLEQYYNARAKKKQLETRLYNFREDMTGIKGMQYSPVPHSKTNKVGDGPATLVIYATEIEERIEKQKEKMAVAMLNVMKIMDFLPVDSTERAVLEYRHIDCLSWRQITKEMHMTRTPCNRYYNLGIERLLTFKKVIKIIIDFSIDKKDE